MTNQADFIVIARFPVKPEQRQAFLEHAREDARQSLREEPGCHQFDILIAADDDNTVVLIEAYTDRAAFDAHTKMPHFQPFMDNTKPLLRQDPQIEFFHKG